jgi:hypothetical protein
MGMRPDSPEQVQQQQPGPKTVWHGRLYENFRNDLLDAIPHEVTQNGGTKSLLRRNQFGFNVAGPVPFPRGLHVPRNTFFMLSYEGVRERISRASLHTIPTLPERSGDFSQTVDTAGNLLPVYDPRSTAPNPAYDAGQPVSATNLQYLRSPFPGNRIPVTRLAPDVLKALDLYPAPNTDIGPFFRNNYFVNAPQTDMADGILFKIDQPFHARHRLTSASRSSTGSLTSARYFPNQASPTPPEQRFSSRRSELDYVFTASPRTVYSASVSAASDVTTTGGSSGVPFPVYQLGDYLSMGAAYPDTRSARHTFEVRGGVSTRWGKHSLGLNFQSDLFQVNAFNPAYPSGDFQFTADITSLPGVVNTGMPFAGFLLGLPANAERTVTTAPSYFRNSYQSLSGSDTYVLTRNLTLSTALSLSRRTPRIEKYDRQSTVDPAVIDPSLGLPGALVFAGRDGVSRGFRPANVDLDPSLAISWNPFREAKTVVRASFSRSHGRIPIYNGQWGTQGFNTRQTFISPNVQLSPALDMSAGIPPLASPLPDIKPSAAVNTVADYMDLSGREPVYQSASLSVEHEVPFSMVISAGAGYSGGRDVLVGESAVNPNAISPDYLGYRDALYNQDFRVTLQPFPQYKGFELFQLYPAGRYQRDSAFLRVEKRASFGLTFTAYYEFSKQLDDYSGPHGNQDLFNLRNDWALTSSNTPQYVQLSYIYELPFGSDKPLFNFPDWRGALASGWSVSGTAYWNDGMPLAPHPEFNNTGGVLSTLNVNMVPGVDPHVANPGPGQYFNPAAFDQPSDFTMGDGPRTMPNLLGPGYNSLDLSVNKRLPVGGDRTLEFSAAAFDFLNHANWNTPDTAIGPTTAPNVNAGKIVGSRGGRVVQLGVKLSF